MSHPHRSQRGEGKVGCIVSLLLLVAAVATLFKAFPVYYSNFELADACDLIATEASRQPQEQVEANVKSKARELGIEEAKAPGAIRVTKSVTGQSGEGSCTIILHYKRSIDLYGLYKWDVDMDKRITKVIYTSI
jgi:hypothetical protein